MEAVGVMEDGMILWVEPYACDHGIELTKDCIDCAQGNGEAVALEEQEEQ